MQREEEKAAALKADGLGSDYGGVPPVFEGLTAGSKYRQGVHSSSGDAGDDSDVPIRLPVPVSISNGGLMGACSARGRAVVMQRPLSSRHTPPHVRMSCLEVIAGCTFSCCSM